MRKSGVAGKTVDCERLTADMKLRSGKEANGKDERCVFWQEKLKMVQKGLF